MTRLPVYRVQCDRCGSVYAPVAKNAKDWGEEMYSLGWVVRRRMFGKSQHACSLCARDFVAEFDNDESDISV